MRKVLVGLMLLTAGCPTAEESAGAAHRWATAMGYEVVTVRCASKWYSAGECAVRVKGYPAPIAVSCYDGDCLLRSGR